MKQARDERHGQFPACTPEAPVAAVEAEQDLLIELKPLLTGAEAGDERSAIEAGASTLMRVVSGALRREAGLIDPQAIFGDEDEDYDDEFEDDDDEEDDDLDEDDEDDDDEEDDEFDDDDEEDEDEFDDLDEEEEEEDAEFEADLDD